jgi:hypothetical protein
MTDWLKVSTTTIAVTIGVVVVGYLLFRDETPVSVTKGEKDEGAIPVEGGLGLLQSREPILPPGKRMFEPSLDWKSVGDDEVCPPGLEYKLNVYEGTKLARIPPPE